MKKFMLIIIAAIIIMMPMTAFATQINLDPTHFPQAGFDKEWADSSSDVVCELKADKTKAAAGETIKFSLNISKAPKFLLLQCVPVYDVTVFDAVANGNKLTPAITIPDPLLSSFEYEGTNAAGIDINAYNCVATWDDEIEFEGSIFEFSLTAKQDIDTEKLPVYVFIKMNATQTGTVTVYENIVGCNGLELPESTPEAAPTPENTAKSGKRGCGGIMAGSAFIIMAAGAFMLKKKK